MSGDNRHNWIEPAARGCGVLLATTLLATALASQAHAFTFRVLHTFCNSGICSDGDFPQGHLVTDGAAFYGLATGGGLSGSYSQGGLVYKLVFNSSKGKWVYTILYKFCSLSNCADGEQDASHGLVGFAIDGSGNLYGTAPEGGKFGQGVLFRLSPASSHWKETVLYNFCKATSCTDGAAPGGDLGVDLWGNVYGTTSNGGTDNLGTAYEVTSGGAHKVLYSFGTKAVEPTGVILGSGGALYGTATVGGKNDEGTVFELSPAARPPWTESTLHSFCNKANCSDGAWPQASVAMDAGGNLFGTTWKGEAGANCASAANGDCGVVYEVTSGGKEEVLHAFCSAASCADGSGPNGDLLISGTTLYGMTNFGGSTNSGTLFQLAYDPAKGRWREKVLHNFCSIYTSYCVDGANPNWSGLTMDSAGNLYGVTESGGKNNGGIAFELAK